MAFTVITDNQIDQASPIDETLMAALRDNLPATAAGENLAPILQSAWHPYNKINVGDSSDGTIYDFSVDGVTTTVETPSFADGYDYGLVFDGLSDNGGAVWNVDFYDTDDAVWRTVVSTGGTASVSDVVYSLIEFPSVRAVSSAHVAWVKYFGGGSRTMTTAQITIGAAQKINKARVRAVSGSFDAGKIIMIRRLRYF